MYPGSRDAERNALAGRIMLCRKVDVVPIECIARGYITGSGWKDYQKTGCGLRHSAAEGSAQRRSTSGADLHAVDEGRIRSRREHQLRRGRGGRRRRPDALARATRRSICTSAPRLTRCSAASFWRTRSSSSVGSRAKSRRCWSTRSSRPTVRASGRPIEWRPGGEQPSFDKQYVRDYLETLVSDGRWNKTPPGPSLPR